MIDVFKKINMALACAVALVLSVLAVPDLEAATQRTFSAGEAMATQGVRVYISAANTVSIAGAANEDIGTTLAPVASSGLVPIIMTDVGEVADFTANGAVTAGADVYPAASGKVSATVSGKRIGKALTTVTTDGDTIKVVRLSTAADRVIINFPVVAASVDTWVFTADRAYTVVSIKENHSVVGGTSAAVAFRKVTADAVAPGAGAGATCIELQTAGIDLTATVNTTITSTLSAVSGAINLAAGDKIGADFSGTLTGLVGCVTIELKPR